MAKKTVNETLDCLDSLQQKLAQLGALLAMSYGAAGDTFRNMNEELQDNYLWACSTLANECAELAGSMAGHTTNLKVERAQTLGAAHA